MLALRALALLGLTRAALVLVPFSRIRRVLAAEGVRTMRGSDWPALVSRAVSRAARSVPGTTCLVQAIVATHLLHRGGHEANLVVGVARGDPSGAPLLAHAWVECGAYVVTGNAERERYAELVRLDAGA